MCCNKMLPLPTPRMTGFAFLTTAYYSHFIHVFTMIGVTRTQIEPKLWLPRKVATNRDRLRSQRKHIANSQTAQSCQSKRIFEGIPSRLLPDRHHTGHPLWPVARPNKPAGSFFAGFVFIAQLVLSSSICKVSRRWWATSIIFWSCWLFKYKMGM